MSKQTTVVIMATHLLEIHFEYARPMQHGRGLSLCVKVRILKLTLFCMFEPKCNVKSVVLNLCTKCLSSATVTL